MIAAVQRLYSCDYVIEVMKKPVRQVIFPAGIGFLFSFLVIFIVHLFIHFCFPHAADPYVSAFMYPFSFSYSLCPVLYFLHPGYQQYAILSFQTSFDFLMQKRLPLDSLHTMNFSCLFSMRFTMRSDNPIFSDICEGLIPCCVKRLTTTGSGSLTSMICMSGS